MDQLWIVIPVLAGVYFGYRIIKRDDAITPVPSHSVSGHMREERKSSGKKILVYQEQSRTPLPHSKTTELQPIEKA